MNAPRNFTERVRDAEFALMRDEFAATDRVLEIGGGSGFMQARIKACVDVCVSVDVARHPDPVGDVMMYDGVNLPFDDASFDIVFSTSVLEHVKDLDALFAECARVLKPGGKMVHVLPTHWWRVWTLLSYYPALPLVLSSNLRNLRNEPLAAAPRGGEQTAAAPPNKSPGLFVRVLRRFRLKWLRTILISPRHGERGNELSEIYYFRPAWWRRYFAEQGWTVETDYPAGFFYSGNTLLGDSLPLGARRFLSGVLGSSTWIFRLKP